MRLTIDDLIWDDWNEQHIARHHILRVEVEDVCYEHHWTLRANGHDKLAIYGQTSSGRYLVVIVAQRGTGTYYPVTAREMSDTERRRFQGWRS